MSSPAPSPTYCLVPPPPATAGRHEVAEERHAAAAAQSGFQLSRDLPVDLGVVLSLGDEPTWLEQLVSGRIRHLLIQPPAFSSLASMDTVRAWSRRCRIPVTVAFADHWLPQRRQLSREIRGGRWGRLQSVVAAGAEATLRGIPPHIDLLCQLCGYCPLEVSARGATPDQLCLFEEIRIRFGTGAEGILRRSVDLPEKLKLSGTAGSAVLDNESVDGSGAAPLKLAYNEIAGLLQGGTYPDCTNFDYAIVHEAAFAACESLLRGGEAVSLPCPERSRHFGS